MVGLTSCRLQYSRLIKTSMGALVMEQAFLIWNTFGDMVKSARRPKKKVSVASKRPMMVRNWRCQPYDWLLLR